MMRQLSPHVCRCLLASSALAVAAGTWLVTGCDGFSFSGNFGVTPGGVKDMAYARQVIEDGGIPDPSAITVEEFVSEHAIDIPAPPDAGTLYATATIAWNADFDELTPLITVQVGLGSSIDPDEFERTALNLCLVIDRSGSMADPFDERTRTSKIDAVRIAIDRLLAQLTAQDRVSVVMFAEEATVLLDPAPGDGVAAVKSALDEITLRGDADLAQGMLRAYQLIEANHNAARFDRLMVFTDAGLRQSDGLIDVMEEFADQGIGATIVGVGTDFGPELTADIAKVRGGNFVYLNDYDRIVQVFDEEFDFLVSPIAYDVRLAAVIPFALDVADTFGLPDAEGSGHTLELVIPSLFYGQQVGAAIFIRLRPGALVEFGQSVEAASLSLDYKTTIGEAVADATQVSLPAGQDPDAEQPYFQTETAQRSVLLINTALVLKNACRDTYAGYVLDEATGQASYQFPSVEDYDRAIARLSEFLPYFEDLADGLEDQPSPTSRSLSQERSLLEKLLANVRTQRGTPEGFAKSAG